MPRKCWRKQWITNVTRKLCKYDRK